MQLEKNVRVAQGGKKAEEGSNRQGGEREREECGRNATIECTKGDCAGKVRRGSPERKGKSFRRGGNAAQNPACLIIGRHRGRTKMEMGTHRKGRLRWRGPTPNIKASQGTKIERLRILNQGRQIKVRGRPHVIREKRSNPTKEHSILQRGGKQAIKEKNAKKAKGGGKGENARPRNHLPPPRLSRPQLPMKIHSRACAKREGPDHRRVTFDNPYLPRYRDRVSPTNEMRRNSRCAVGSMSRAERISSSAGQDTIQEGSRSSYDA